MEKTCEQCGARFAVIECKHPRNQAKANRRRFCGQSCANLARPPVPHKARFETGPKQCAKCKEIKPRSDFGLHRTQSSGLMSYCRPCKSEIQKKARPLKPVPVRWPALYSKKLYQTWEGIHQRCRGKDPRNRHYYTNRGITVCDRWNTFRFFAQDMGEPPTQHHSIDRINNDGNYEPGNCRWATWDVQHANRRPRQVQRLTLS